MTVVRQVNERLDSRLRAIPPDEVNDLIARLSEIDEFKGWWLGRRLSDRSILERLRRGAVKISAAVSTGIDGRGQPAAHGEHAWRGRTLPRREPQDGAVPGYAEALRAVFDGYRQMQFGEELIMRLHARVLRYSDKDRGHRGKYKTLPDVTTSHLRNKIESLALRSAVPDLIPGAMAAAAAWTTTRLASARFHPLLVIAGFVLEFLAIRPFADGNGRLSRILTNLLLLQRGYAYVPYASLEAVIADRRTEYYLALRRSQANTHLPRPDITPWLRAFLEAMQVQARQLRNLLEQRPDDSRLSHNQLGVLQLLDHTDEVTNRLVCQELDMSKDTAKQVLNRLVILNLVRRVGAGRAVRYRRAAPQDGNGGAR